MSKTCGGPEYSVWWQISDSNHAPMGCCEIMVKLLTHCSMPKTDDVRLKGMTMATKFCVMCDLGAPARHMILECPALQQMRNVMFI